MRRDFFVVMAPDADSERFAILWHDTIPVGAHLWSPVETHKVFLAIFRAVRFVSELQIRADLATMGLPTDDIEDQIDRARRMVTSSNQITWEQTTKVGYRNGVPLVRTEHQAYQRARRRPRLEVRPVRPE